MKYRFLIWSLIALGIFAVVLAIVGFITRPVPASSDELAIPVSDNDWYLGSKNAKVTLVEYSDFECPACKAYAPIITLLNKDFPNDLKIVYRHFPLPQHKNARVAAQAAEAAGKQGKFWEMENLIFEKQNEWADNSNAEENFVSYATSLGLNIEKFKSDFNSDLTKTKIESDYASGEESKLTYTPTFFLNSKKISNPQNYEEFKSLIETRIGK
ncbi:MAG: DsbA family protein [Patescibacteria group bacterium]|nr:DsbA family protein [Patescibacteria group bacterium]